MTAETTFPLHPECEATLAANPGRVYLFDLTLPARAATAEEVAEYGQRHTDPKWRDLYRFAGYTGHAEAAPPVAASLPDLQVGETAARLEATVAAYEAGAEVASSIARGIGEAGVTLTGTGRGDGHEDLPGQPTVSDPVDVRDVDALPGEPDQTAVMPAADLHTQTFEAVPGTEGDATP